MRRALGWALIVLAGPPIAVGVYLASRVWVARASGWILLLAIAEIGVAALIGAWLLLSGWRLRGTSPEPPPYAR